MIPILPRIPNGEDGADGVADKYKYMWESFFLFFIRSI